ncbi:MAG: hypothetical protein AAB853_04700, partial [Patescibacteria group bacterium]
MLKRNVTIRWLAIVVILLAVGTGIAIGIHGDILVAAVNVLKPRTIWNRQAPSFSPPASCGDNMCDTNEETCVSCPKDCKYCWCNDKVCQSYAPYYETCVSCPNDCGMCACP